MDYGVSEGLLGVCMAMYIGMFRQVDNGLRHAGLPFVSVYL